MSKKEECVALVREVKNKFGVERAIVLRDEYGKVDALAKLSDAVAIDALTEACRVELGIQSKSSEEAININNPDDTVVLTRGLLFKAFLAWSVNERAGNCVTQEEKLSVSIEEDARRATEALLFYINAEGGSDEKG